MAGLTPAFHVESERIHHDHQVMLKQLTELELEFERLHCTADLRVASKIQETFRKMARLLPEHCLREETWLYATVAQVSAELATFAEEMKREHANVLAALNAFCVALDELPNFVDFAAAIRQLHEQGLDVVRVLRAHITLEEKELSGFL